MAPQTLAPGQGKRAGREPLFDVHPQTGAPIEVFYPTAHWRRSAGAALVGFGGLDGAAIRRQARPRRALPHELRSVSGCGEGQGLRIVIRHRAFGTLVEPF